MKYHVIPYPPLDGPTADGGNFDRAYRAPLAERPRVSVGGKSGAVHVHVREQGRPQGAGFSAGDLSRRLKRSEFRGHRRLSFARLRCARSNRHRHHGGDIGGGRRGRTAKEAAGFFPPDPPPPPTAPPPSRKAHAPSPAGPLPRPHQRATPPRP